VGWASQMPSLRRAFGMKVAAGAGRAPELWWCVCLCDVLGLTVLVCGPWPEGRGGVNAPVERETAWLRR